MIERKSEVMNIFTLPLRFLRALADTIRLAFIRRRMERDLRQAFVALNRADLDAWVDKVYVWLCSRMETKE